MSTRQRVVGWCMLCTAARVIAVAGSPATPQVVEKQVVQPESAKPVEKQVVQTVAVQKEVAKEAVATAPVPAAGSSHLTDSERMIVKNAEVELLVQSTAAAIDQVTAVAVEYGGYLVNSHTWYEGEFQQATLSLGVPVAEFENVLRRLRGLATRVEKESSTGEDVTDEYVDLASQARNLEATADRIRTFLEKANTVEEALKVNAELSKVEEQIETIKGRMNYLKDRAAFSTITVQLTEPRPTATPTSTLIPTATPTPATWRPGDTMRVAGSGLAADLRAVIDALIVFVIRVVPFLLPVAVLVWALVLWRRRRARPGPAGGSAAEPQSPRSQDKA
jgi:hypothetical protein